MPEGATIAEEAEVITALQSVFDPEIPVNIYDLGLIYQCEIDHKGDVAITMTLTAPAALWLAKCQAKWPRLLPMLKGWDWLLLP